MKKLIVLIIFNLTIVLSNTAQNENIIDSLNQLFLTSKVDTQRIEILYEIANKYLNINPDTSLIISKKGIDLSQKVGFKKGIASGYTIIGNAYLYMANYSSALNEYTKALTIAEKINNRKIEATAYINIGNVYVYQRNFQEAINHYNKSNSIGTSIKDEKIAISSLTNIASAYQMMDDISKALEKYFEIIEIALKQGDNYLVCSIYSNVTLCYISLGENELAIKYANKSIEVAEKNNLKILLVRSNGLLGRIYQNMGNKANAIYYSKRSLEGAQKLNDLQVVHAVSDDLYQLYEGIGDFRNALHFFQIHVEAKDSIFNESKNKEINGLQLTYEREKNIKEKAILEKDKTIIQEKAQKQKIIIISISTGLGLLIFMVTFILRRLRITRRQKKIIEEKNVEITAQNTLINQQKNDIVSSITYASRIQNALIPPVSEVVDILPEHFILFKPRDIVSGDFFWVKKVDNLVYIVAADCTGHGVPGAFMSMLGISLLNEILSGSKVIPPHEVLNELRIRVKKSLHQKGDRNEAKDGMDIALCLYDYDSRVLHFAGAHNPLYIVRNHELIEYKADRMPIGVHHNDNVDFTTTSVELKANDLFYTFSDGYASQFGGIKGETFKSKRLQELLLSVSEKSMVDQKEILNQTIEDWRGDLKQIDDICVIGVKVV